MRCVNGGFVVARFRFLLAASQGRCVGLRRGVPAQTSPSQPPPHGWVDVPFDWNGLTMAAQLWPMWNALAELPIHSLSAETLDDMGRRHPGMRSAIVAGVGHAPMLDEPEAVDAIGRFLDEIIGGATTP